MLVIKKALFNAVFGTRGQPGAAWTCRGNSKEKDFEAQQAPATPAAAEPCVEEARKLRSSTKGRH